MTESEEKSLWSAIREEQLPLISAARKKTLKACVLAFVGVLVLYIGLRFRDGSFDHGYLIAVMGTLAVMIIILGLPTPRSLGDDEFRCKPLRITTVEKLRASLGHNLLDKLLTLKNAHPDGCLRVNDIFYLLEVADKEADESTMREIAQNQQIVLSSINNEPGQV